MFNNFGEFIAAKQIDHQITLRKMADMLDCSAAFLSDVEKNRRKPLDLERLEKISNILQLSSEERILMFDLVGNQRVIAPDLPQYINENTYVRFALRKARDLNASEAEWQEFVQTLENKHMKEHN